MSIQGVKTRFYRALTRSLDVVNRAAVPVMRRRLAEMAKSHPDVVVMPAEQILARATQRLPRALQLAIRETTGEEMELKTLRMLISSGIKENLFVNYGDEVFINPHRVDSLLSKLGIPADKKPVFLEEARRRILLPDSSQPGIRTFEYNGKPYYIRKYPIRTRDGKILVLLRIINQDAVKANDDRPSVLLLPGIACDHKEFNMDNETSVALEMADQGRWVYLLDFRGMGKNKGEWDPNCSLDTLVSNDLPAAVEFISKRPTRKDPSQIKPVFVIGHSMGGDVAEFTVIRQAFHLKRMVDEIVRLAPGLNFSTKKKKRPEIAAFLDKVENRIAEYKEKEKIRERLDEARSYLAVLQSFKVVVPLCSPLNFDKFSHPILQLLLLISPANLLVVKEDRVPAYEAKKIIGKIHFLAHAARSLINPANFDKPLDFLVKFISRAVDSFPNRLGLQYLKAFKSGKGIYRMGDKDFCYTDLLELIPPDLPVIRIAGTHDPLNPPENLAYVDHNFKPTLKAPQKAHLNLGSATNYSHEIKRVIELSSEDSLNKVDLQPDSSQAIGISVEGLGHLDCFYGKTGMRVIRPLISKIIQVFSEIK